MLKLLATKTFIIQLFSNKLCTHTTSHDHSHNGGRLAVIKLITREWWPYIWWRCGSLVMSLWQHLVITHKTVTFCSTSCHISAWCLSCNWKKKYCHYLDILTNWSSLLTESICTLRLVSFSSSFCNLLSSFGNITMEIVVSLLNCNIIAVIIATEYLLLIKLANQIITMFRTVHQCCVCLIEIVLRQFI